jgi:hypothetical protein
MPRGFVARVTLSVALLAAPARADELATRVWRFGVAEPGRAQLTLQNLGPGAAVVEPQVWNGGRVFHERGELEAEIERLPAEADGSLATRNFRFVAANRQHGYPLTLDFSWLLSPTLFFNSTGVALCGEAADLIQRLASERGLSARVWRLGGHVVAEIQSGGRWQMYDGDYGVYFLNRQGAIASVAELAADPTLITSPVLRLAVPGPWSPYSSGYAALFSSTWNNALRATAPPFDEARRVRFALPRGASLRFPGHQASAPLDHLGAPQTDFADYADLTLRLAAGARGSLASPLIVHTLRGSGVVAIGAQTFTIGSPELQAKIDAREDALAQIEILEAPEAIEVVYLVNPLRWRMRTEVELVAGVTPDAALDVRVVPAGDPADDSDADGVADDGGGNGVVGDTRCAGAGADGCDDNCLERVNPLQRDADGDSRGNACDGDLDQDELLTSVDYDTLRGCLLGGSPPHDSSCLESDLDENGRVDDFDRQRWVAMAGSAPTPACGLGPELIAILLALHGGFRRPRAR